MANATDPKETLRVLDEELRRALALVTEASTQEGLEQAEVSVLGRRAPLSGIQRALGSLGEQDRRTVGRRTNEVRQAILVALAERRGDLEQERERELLEADRVDLSLPGRRPPVGSLHPLTLTEYEIVDVFMRMGYRVVEGRETETDWYNFQALNIPPDHPARTMKDTFYLALPDGEDLLLRTETSAMQIRTMESQDPPVYAVMPGRVFRRDVTDATHTPVFHQLEGLAVDEGLSFADLAGTLEEFAKQMFGSDQRVRLTPSYFPFVEPGAQVEVSCPLCGGRGCKTCGGGWIEVLGAGMVHPAVFENVGYDPERYTGFAFGLGLERVAMLRYQVPDIRLFFEGDMRFLEQFDAAAPK